MEAGRRADYRDMPFCGPQQKVGPPPVTRWTAQMQFHLQCRIPQRPQQAQEPNLHQRLSQDGSLLLVARRGDDHECAGQAHDEILHRIPPNVVYNVLPSVPIDEGTPTTATQRQADALFERIRKAPSYKRSKEADEASRLAAAVPCGHRGHFPQWLRPLPTQSHIHQADDAASHCLCRRGRLVR